MRLLSILVGLALLSSSAIGAMINKKVDIGTTVAGGKVETGGADTIRFEFTERSWNNISFYFLTDTITGEGTDSALVLGKSYPEKQIRSKIDGETITWSIDDLQDSSPYDTLWWNDANGDSMAFVDYPNNGKGEYIWDEESQIAAPGIYEMIIKDGNLAGNGGFKYAVVTRTIGR